MIYCSLCTGRTSFLVTFSVRLHDTSYKLLVLPVWAMLGAAAGSVAILLLPFHRGDAHNTSLLVAFSATLHEWNVHHQHISSSVGLLPYLCSVGPGSIIDIQLCSVCTFRGFSLHNCSFSFDKARFSMTGLSLQTLFLILYLLPKSSSVSSLLPVVPGISELVVCLSFALPLSLYTDNNTKPLKYVSECLLWYSVHYSCY